MKNIDRVRPHPVLLLLLSGLAAAPAGTAQNAPGGEPKERAVAALEQDLKSDPHNVELWVHLGFAYRKDGQMDKAEGAFEKAVAMDPRNRESLYMLGLIYESKHQTQEALKVWNQYLGAETDPEKRQIAEKHIHHLSQ